MSHAARVAVTPSETTSSPPEARLSPPVAGRLLLIALVVGVVSDQLLRVTPWGLNLLPAVAVLLGSGFLFARGARVPLEGDGRFLAVPIVLFAAAFAWRDSPTLTAANGLALVVAIALAALTGRAGQLTLAGVTQYPLDLAYMLGHALAGLAPVLLGDLGRRGLAQLRVPAWGLAVARGVLLAVPPLFLFGGLFVAADAQFDRLVHRYLELDLGSFAVRTTMAIAYAWLAGGLFREMLLATEHPSAASRATRPGRLGILEIGVALSLLDALFLSFVLVQVRYLFGGLAQVETFGYSEYARRGFFELVWVAGLTLPLLLLAHWALRKDRRAERLFARLAGVLVLLLFVVMASAVLRLRLYVEDSGLTELRIQAAVLMAWLAVVLVWFAATVLRGRRRRFAFGALATGFATIVVLDVLNPDALVVQTNAANGHLTQYLGTRDGDHYLASFSADATPAIVAALPEMSPPDRVQVEAKLRAHWASPVESDDDWRSFNWDRARAREAVAAIAPTPTPAELQRR